MLILGIHSGWLDAGAALFEGYRPLAAMPLARLTGVARDGGRVPVEAVAECLAIAGAGHTDIGAVTFSHGIFPGRYFTGLPLRQRLRRGLQALIGRDAPASLAEQAALTKRDAATLIDTAALLGDLGLNRNIPVHFYTRHAARALLPLFQTSWDEALLFTGHVDREPEEARLLKYGRLAAIDGAAATAPSLGHLVALAVDGLGLPDPASLFALAPYGEPLLAQALAAHVAVDNEGRIHTDFSRDGGAEHWLRRLAEGHAPAILAASLFKLVEDSIALSVERLMQRHDVAHLALGGEMLADPRLLHNFARRVRLRGLSVDMTAGESSLPLGGVLDFLLARDGLVPWLRQRPSFPVCATGRDYGADIDPVLGNAGCRLVSQDAVRATAALLRAEKSIALYGRQSFGLQQGAERSILFAADRAGMAGEINRRLDRPTFLPPVLFARSGDAAQFFDTAPAILPDGTALPAPLATAWRARLPAFLAPDFLCQPCIVDAAAEPLAAALLEAYAAASEIPALAGLPLQIGGEAAMDAPKDVLRLLRDGRVDYLATENAVWERG